MDGLAPMLLQVDTQEEVEPGRSPHVRGAVVVVALVLLTSAVVAAVALPSLPDVRGMTERQALQELESAGFQVTVAKFPPPYGDFVSCYEPSDVVGLVIGQDPCPGPLSRARRGSQMTVWIRLPDVRCDAPAGAGCA